MASTKVVIVLAAVTGLAGMVGWAAYASPPPAGEPGPEPLGEPRAELFAPPAELEPFGDLLAERPERPWWQPQHRPGPPWSEEEGPEYAERREKMEQLRRLAAELREIIRERGLDDPGVRELREKIEDLKRAFRHRRGPEGRFRPEGPPRHFPEKLRRFAVQQRMLEVWQRSGSDPLRSVLVAAQQIVELAGDKPEVAVDVLEDLLERVEALPARTVLRFALKEALIRADDRRGAIEQLQKVIAENSRKIQRIKPRRPGPPERRGKSERPERREHAPKRHGPGGPERH